MQTTSLEKGKTMSSQTNPFGRLIAPAVGLCCLVLDAMAKSWARSTLVEGQSQQFLPGMCLTLTTNTGAAFSLGSGNGALMAALATTMTVVLLTWAIRRELSPQPPSPLDRIGFGCLIGGAFGNLLDRFLRGRVTDFFEFTFVAFPVFNVADVLIDVGITLLIIAALRKQEKNKDVATQL